MRSRTELESYLRPVSLSPIATNESSALAKAAKVVKESGTELALPIGANDVQGVGLEVLQRGVERIARANF